MECAVWNDDEVCLVRDFRDLAKQLIEKLLCKCLVFLLRPDLFAILIGIGLNGSLRGQLVVLDAIVADSQNV